MDEIIKFFVGLDVHKDTIAVAVAEAGRAPARLMGSIAHDVGKLIKLLARYGEARQVQVVYEAGPTGYGLQRELARRGYLCQVIAPSLIPKRAGDRVKTDRRDSLRLAELSRAGELRAIWIPDPADEAIRDLARAREDAVNARTQMRQQLKGFLLRHDVRYVGKSAWSKTYYRWLATLNFGLPGAQTAFTEYWQAVTAADERVARLTEASANSIESWRFEPVVRALQALRGIDQISAIGLVAEIGDIGRFAHPRQLMGYLGLVPSESSSGEQVARGSITKTGNAHARRLLTEAAWSYRFQARIGYLAQRRAEDLPQDMKEYSPYENVTAQPYPAIFALGSLNDTRVSYHEPAKWMARLRATAGDTQGGGPFMLKIEMEAGHGGRSGRYDAWHEEAQVLAWIIEQTH